MNCPACAAPKMVCHASLVCTKRDGAQRFSSQWWRCSACEATFYGVLTEWTADGWVEHRGHPVPDKRWRRTLQVARTCPAPLDPACTCTAHQTYATPFFGGTAEIAWETTKGVFEAPAAERPSNVRVFRR
jgi:hypothetical protein